MICALTRIITKEKVQRRKVESYCKQDILIIKKKKVKYIAKTDLL